MKKICLLLVLLVTLIGCQESNEQSGVNSVAVIEVDIFSGRPNPQFELTQENSAELTTLLNDLPRDDVLASAPDIGLGFRGFVIRQLDLNDIEAVTYVRVYKEFVSIYGDKDELVTIYDEQKTISQFLETAFSTVDPELYKAIASDSN